MKSDWLEATTADLIDRGVLQIGDGYRAKNSELSVSGLPFARVSNINDGFRFDDADRFPESDLAKVGEKISRPGDIVFTSKGTVGRFALVRQQTPRFVYSPQLSYWRSIKPEILHPGFLFYWMQSPEFRLQADSVKGQTDMADYVSLSDQRRMRLSLPDITLQRAIARILGSLDDKIALNRRMNRTLEALAAAIFKSWFVDFDPVIARAEGRQPFGMDAETAALFPAAFEESEVGPVPVGWAVGSILEAADLLSGGTPSTSVASYWDGDIPWVSAKDVSNANGLFVLETERTITPEGLEHSAAKLLPKLTTVVTARGTVGSYCLLGREMAMNQTNYGLKAKEGVGDYFVFFTLAQMVEQLKQHAYGTIFDTVTTRTFSDVQAILPDHATIQRYEQRVSPLMELALGNLQQSRTLTALRGALLPKLMSGEIRVG